MAVYKSKGIVLRSIRYSEADRILDIYTRDAGLISAIAKGIRRTKSRFRGRRRYGRERARHLGWRRGGPQGLQPALQRPGHAGDVRFWVREHRGGPRHKALHPRRLRSATRWLPGLWDGPRRGFGAAAFCPRSRGRPVPGVPPCEW